MQKITATVLRHRALVALVWIVLTVIGGVMVGKANSGLTHKQATPGLAGYDANQAMIHQVGLDGGEAPARSPPPPGRATSGSSTTARRTTQSSSRPMGAPRGRCMSCPTRTLGLTPTRRT